MISEKRLRKLSNPDYRDEYLKSTITGWLVHQLRALRRERNWTQADLAEKAGDLPQSAIGRYESESYGNWNTNTLLKLAKAFDVALEIRFVSWPHFIRTTSDTSAEAMQVPSFHQSSFLPDNTVYQRFSSPPTEQVAARTAPRLGAVAYRQDDLSRHRGMN